MEDWVDDWMAAMRPRTHLPDLPSIHALIRPPNRPGAACAVVFAGSLPRGGSAGEQRAQHAGGHGNGTLAGCPV
jgi:hypothetical protein